MSNEVIILAGLILLLIALVVAVPYACWWALTVLKLITVPWTWETWLALTILIIVITPKSTK